MILQNFRYATSIFRKLSLFNIKLEYPYIFPSIPIWKYRKILTGLKLLSCQLVDIVARIYISSTFEDLKDYREKVRVALRQMGHEDIEMEYYVAEDKRPLDKCLEDVASCDLYIGIFAWRYGYVPDGYGKSITELEYRKAVETGKKCLIFLLDEEVPWPIKFVDRGKNEKRIRALKKELSKEKTVSFFKSADELASFISPAVHI
jgi:hypothetical protein